MKKIVLLGIAAAFFFSSTFAINRWLNVEQGGHWYWTASLRYIYVFLYLSIISFFPNGFKIYKETIICFFDYWYFWIFTGGIGFGLFYLSLCYAASYSPGWVLATTWQITILMTPLVIRILGYKVPTRGIVYLLIMFLGILLVNYDEFTSIFLIDLKSVIPITFAAFCYPLGNTLCKYACEGKYKKFPINKYSISNNVFSQILMMTMGAFPVLLFFWIFTSPPAPTYTQFYSIAFIALFTGVIATSLLYQARKSALQNALALSAADGTQAAEAPLALFWEWSIFNGLLPSVFGIVGLILVILGIFLFYNSQIILNTPNEENNKSIGDVIAN